MFINDAQLATRLKQGLAAIYLVTGDEPLLVQESVAAICRAAQKNGFDEQRQRIQVDKGFDWNSLLQEVDSPGLFAEKRIIDIHLQTLAIGKEGGNALLLCCQRLSDDQLLLLRGPKLDKKKQGAKWIAAIAEHGVVTQTQPPKPHELPKWVQQRMKKQGLVADPQLAAFIAEQGEGNLLACAQEIEKLALLYAGKKVTMEEAVAAISNQARYNIFTLADSALKGDVQRSTRIIQGLKQEGAEPVLVLWALAKEVRTLYHIANGVAQGRPVRAEMKKQGVWSSREGLVQTALQRHSIGRWRKMLKLCTRTDQVIKGALPGNPWDELLRLALIVAGVDLFPVMG